MPCLIFEDDHLLVVNKPAGLNTHSPSPYAGEGIYEWLRNREPRWANLAIIHRLDKETSGVLAFSKTTLANRSLTAQFTARSVCKKYLLVTDRRFPGKDQLIRNSLVRVGEIYVGRPAHAGAPLAETHFRLAPHALALSPNRLPRGGQLTLLQAEPTTGRTHQIRVHAAENGFPIVGDTLYGGTPALRLFLHAAEIRFKHPASGEDVKFAAPVDFAADARLGLRIALIDESESNCFRINHGDADGSPGWYVDKLGELLLAQTEEELTETHPSRLSELLKISSARGAYQKRLLRQVRRSQAENVSPRHVTGAEAPRPFVVLENGLSFELSFQEGYSVGLFLDQRDNRRRLLRGYIGPGFELGKVRPRRTGAPFEVLNTFAYTCAFSVCAARAGARTTNLDLSKKYLEWGRRNFALNGLDAAEHDFIYGDVFDWLPRLQKKGRRFDLILLDPPTFSASRETGVFKAERDYGKLVSAALPLIRPDGVLFASTNAAEWPAEDFLRVVRGAVAKANRKILREHYAPQPPDFPAARNQPAYLKTVWLRIG